MVMKMISNEMRKLIEPYLKMQLPRDEYKYIDNYFEETYLDYNNGQKLIALCPVGTDYLTMEFSSLNGAYVGSEFWGEVKARGKKL